MRYTSSTIAMGVVVIPVQVANAVQEDDSLLHKHHKADGGGMKYKGFCAYCGDEVSPGDVRLGYPAADGTVVLLEKDDLDAVYGERTRQMTITMFADVSGLPRAAHDTAYIVKPQAARSAVRAYALLAYALRESGKAAVVSVTISNREATGLLHADAEGYLHLERLRWAANARRPDFEAPNPVLTADEMKMADTFVAEMSGAFDWAAYNDKTAERLDQVVTAKRSTGQVTGTPAAPLAPVLDLTAALKASVEKARAEKAPAPRTRAPRKAKTA